MDQIPKVYSLSQNYPNPFNPLTATLHGLPTQSHVRLLVCNVLGQVVADFVNAEQAAGWNQVVWNMKVSSGLYFYRLGAVSMSDPTKRFVEVKKMALLKSSNAAKWTLVLSNLCLQQDAIVFQKKLV